MRLAPYMRRGQAMIGGGTASSLVKTKRFSRSATTSNNNTDDESSSMQLSAADCGEWLLGRVLGALLLLLLLADKKSENNNNDDDDDANDDDGGEKKATNEVRGLLLAAGVDEATVEQTVKELNWKVSARDGRLFLLFLCDFVCCEHTHIQRVFTF